MHLPATLADPDVVHAIYMDEAVVLTPEAALADLRRFQRHSVSINGAAQVQGTATLQPRQADT